MSRCRAHYSLLCQPQYVLLPNPLGLLCGPACPCCVPRSPCLWPSLMPPALGSLSAVEDLERNDGSAERPYFMSSNLKKLLNKTNKKVES